MKKIGFVIIASLIVLLIGCKIEKNEQKNGKGASAAAYWLDSTEEVLMRCPDIAFKFNAWLTAPAEKKDSIKNLYFPDYDIQRHKQQYGGLVWTDIEFSGLILVAVV